MPELHQFQDDLLQAARAEMEHVRSVVVQAATGAGKTVIGTEALKRVRERGKYGLFMVNRVELVDQTARTFEKWGLPHGIIANGYRPNPFPSIQIASIGSLENALKKGLVRDPALCVWDEAHHMAAPTWARVMAYFRRARHLGLTATPERLDGRGLDAFFEAMVCGPQPGWLIDNNYLAPYRAFGPKRPDLRGVGDRGDDYHPGQLAAIMDTPTLYGDMVENYQRHGMGQKFIAFSVSRDMSRKTAERFRLAGIPAVHVDGDTPAGERRATIEAFRAGKLRGLCNVDLFGEGFDVPDAVVAILGRPTKSFAVHKQQMGRVMRYEFGKVSILLDHAGNLKPGWLPDDETHWTLAGRIKGVKKKRQAEDDIDLGRCGNCGGFCQPGMMLCIGCGGVRIEAVGKQLETVEGVLGEYDVKAMRAARKREQADAQTLDELIELGRRRGYRSPEGWAQHFFSARAAAQGGFDLDGR
jgi:DNA repair protein RadD